MQLVGRSRLRTTAPRHAPRLVPEPLQVMVSKAQKAAKKATAERAALEVRQHTAAEEAGQLALAAVAAGPPNAPPSKQKLAAERAVAAIEKAANRNTKQAAAQTSVFLWSQQQFK